MITRYIWQPMARRGMLSATALALALWSPSAGAQSSASPADTYTWSAELVTVDATARTVTLKAPIVGSDAGDLSEFEAGDHVTLLWSGAHDYAYGIRRVAAGPALDNERFAMPVKFDEFVASETNEGYITFTVALPTAGYEAITTLNPGDWVTATAPVGAHPDQMARLAAIRPYVVTQEG